MKDDDLKNEVIRMSFDEHMPTPRIVELMADKVSRPTVFTWIRQEKDRRAEEAGEQVTRPPLSQAYMKIQEKCQRLEQENEDLKKQIKVLTLCLEKLFEQ